MSKITFQKKKEAVEKRTPQEQIKALDARLGVGIGAKRERARLTAKIEASEKRKKE